jgi:hypothetical protein
MALNYQFAESLQNLFLNFTGTHSKEEDIDGFGVGAIMPQELPDGILLTNTEQYGV